MASNASSYYSHSQKCALDAYVIDEVNNQRDSGTPRAEEQKKGPAANNRGGGHGFEDADPVSTTCAREGVNGSHGVDMASDRD